jgi:hypothetical protein
MIELKIDIDKKDKRDFMRRYQALYRYFRFNLIDYEIAETRKGYHIRLIIDFPFKVTSEEIVLLQLLLGSDWKREMLNYLRVKNGIDDWNKLFIAKYRIYKKGNKVKFRRISHERPIKNKHKL